MVNSQGRTILESATSLRNSLGRPAWLRAIGITWSETGPLISVYLVGGKAEATFQESEYAGFPVEYYEFANSAIGKE